MRVWDPVQSQHPPPPSVSRCAAGLVPTGAQHHPWPHGARGAGDISHRCSSYNIAQYHMQKERALNSVGSQSSLGSGTFQREVTQHRKRLKNLEGQDWVFVSWSDVPPAYQSVSPLGNPLQGVTEPTSQACFRDCQS